ncbi:ATP-binding protein [Rhodopirellula bahusiensis]|nr:ATP-binding protein [Rhodopirellula bahusiensis]
MSHDFRPPHPRTNPFASRHTRPGAIPFRFGLSGSDPSEHTAKIIADLRRYRLGLIVGNHGSGKSTLLHDIADALHSEFPGGKWIQLTADPDRSRIAGVSSVLANDRAAFETQALVSSDGVLVVDGAEQLSPWGRFQIRRHARRSGQVCLVTAHRDLRGFHVLHRTEVTAKLIEDLLQELLRDHPDAREKLMRSSEGQLADSFADVTDVRELWSRLYDVVGLPTEMSESGCSDNRTDALSDARTVRPKTCPDP